MAYEILQLNGDMVYEILQLNDDMNRVKYMMYRTIGVQSNAFRHHHPRSLAETSVLHEARRRPQRLYPGDEENHRRFRSVEGRNSGHYEEEAWRDVTA